MGKKKELNAYFYMGGGHVVVAHNVESVSMTSDPVSGGYTGYKIVWADPDTKPSLFSLSIPEIVAVVVREEG